MIDAKAGGRSLVEMTQPGISGRHSQDSAQGARPSIAPGAVAFEPGPELRRANSSGVGSHGFSSQLCPRAHKDARMSPP